MFGKKQKPKNKFHLPTEEPKAGSAGAPSGPLYSDALTPEVYSEGGSAEEAELEPGAVAPALKYRFITSESKLTEKKPTRNWEIYYRDRNYAGGVGDPLLTVVEASSRQEAESKAQLQECHDGASEVIAVNTNNPIIRYKRESSFAFPNSASAAHSTTKGFSGKA